MNFIAAWYASGRKWKFTWKGDPNIFFTSFLYCLNIWLWLSIKKNHIILVHFKPVFFSSWSIKIMFGGFCNSNLQAIRYDQIEHLSCRYCYCSSIYSKKKILLSEEHLVVQWSNKDIVSYISFGNLFWYVPPQLRLAEERSEEAEERARQLEKQVIFYSEKGKKNSRMFLHNYIKRQIFHSYFFR